MGTILNTVNFSPYLRPLYNSYKLSNEVREKRKKMGLSIDEFAYKYGVETEIVRQIEANNRLFNIKMYKACSKVLEKSIEELTKIEKDKEDAISFRADNISDETRRTIDLTHKLFHEIICQKEIAAR